jgi:uncharacterized membrane protein
MNSGFHRIAGQVLFASNILVAFLFFFENKLVIPAWLQTFGRMHPLMLHFPIVMLLIVMLMEFFRFRPENSSNTFYRNFLQTLLLSGALLAGVTVIMGLFLSREEGYSGEILVWHKWTGIGLFFIASFIYWIRDSHWYKAPIAKAGALLTAVGLVLTGHYGSALTHGNNFIFEPISSTRQLPQVPLEKAVVFDDVIKPILDQKCVSCHNADKVKGQLMLTDAESLLKGGKSGRLFVPGNPQVSLLLERIHLPLEEKKHMPPSGKPQLTAEEVQLLALWVKANADFKQKVITLPANDSLRILATSRLKPVQVREEIYDFDPADEEIIAKLNNDYRTIAILAKESPAVSVNIYNRSAYSVKQLEELGEIKTQIVSLSLNKLPVKNTDLKTIAKFENLRKLDLNFTDVNSDGIKELSGLKHLHSLTLSGTKVDFNGLKDQLPLFRNLKTISVWETPLSQSEIDVLKKENKGIEIIGGFKDDGSNPLKLNPPQLGSPSTIFNPSMAIQLKHPIKGVQIRYTTDGSEPDSLNSTIYDGKAIISQNTTVKALACKAGWYCSDVSSFDYFKSSIEPDSVTLLFPLNRVHQAEAHKTFFNHKLGVIGANNPAWANNWGGVRDNDMGILATFKKPVSVSSVALHYMIEEDTGIFPPALVEVWGGSDPNSMKLLTKFKAAMPVKGEKPTLKTIEGKFKAQSVTHLKIVAKPLAEMPDWHRNKGKKALLLVDEMFIN